MHNRIVNILIRFCLCFIFRNGKVWNIFNTARKKCQQARDKAKSEREMKKKQQTELSDGKKITNILIIIARASLTDFLFLSLPFIFFSTYIVLSTAAARYCVDVVLIAKGAFFVFVCLLERITTHWLLVATRGWCWATFAYTFVCFLTFVIFFFASNFCFISTFCRFSLLLFFLFHFRFLFAIENEWHSLWFFHLKFVFGFCRHKTCLIFLLNN